MNKNIKELEEVKNCTFAPEINQTSLTLTQANYVPVHEREMPKKKSPVPPKPEEGLEELKDLHPKRKHNPKFYDEKLQWKVEQKEKNNKKRMNKALDEISKSNKMPKTNKSVNEKLFKKEEDFLLR